MRSSKRSILATVGAIGLAVAGGALWAMSGGDSEADGPWPPTRTLPGGGTHPALLAAYYHCHGDMTLKHEWLAYTDMSFGPGAETLVLDQRSREWIEGYFSHLVDDGTRDSMYNLEWIEEYLGHPLPDGYFLWAGHACILEFLDAPPEIVDRILATTAEDGEVSETWSTFQITWTNNGVDGPDAVLSYYRP